MYKTVGSIYQVSITSGVVTSVTVFRAPVCTVWVSGEIKKGLDASLEHVMKKKAAYKAIRMHRHTADN